MSGAPLRENDDAGSHPLGSRLVWRADAAPQLFRLSTLRAAGDCEIEVRPIADPLPVGEEVAGELAPGVSRYHLLPVEEGFRYSLTSTGDFDGVLTLFGPAGEELAWNDDSQGPDPRIDWLVDENGTFVVELAAWSGSGAYRLRATREEVGEILAGDGAPVALEPGRELIGRLDPGRVQELTFAAVAGRGYLVQAAGLGEFDSHLTLFDAEGRMLAENDDFGTGRDARLDWLAPADGTYAIELREYGDVGGEYAVSLVELPDVASIAAARERQGAMPVEVGVEVAGSLPAEAPQWLRFAARAGHAYRVEAAALPLDTRLWLYSEAAGDDLLAMNDDREAEDWEPAIEWLSEEDTTVDLRLDEREGTPGGFRFSVREIEPTDALREAAARRPFDGYAVGDRVRLGRHRPIDGVHNWDPAMEPWVGQTATVAELVGQEDDTGAWVVRVDVDGGEWVWRTADLRPAD